MMLGRSLVAVFPMKSQAAPLASPKENIVRQWSQGLTFISTWETVSPCRSLVENVYQKSHQVIPLQI